MNTEKKMSQIDLNTFIFSSVANPTKNCVEHSNSLDYIKNLLQIQAHVPKCIPEDKARDIFRTLRTQIDWSDREGLPQFNDFVSQFPELSQYIDNQVDKLRETYPIPNSRMATIVTFLPDGVYEVWDHYHPGQCEVKFSFGGSRPVIVNDETYEMSRGDAIIFGPLHHSVPPHCGAEEQINIVTYYTDEAHNINL